MFDYKALLMDELILALGCTEPIAIALAAASAGELTDEAPEKIDVYASGSIIKNANSVYVPNSGGQQGVLISAALGALTRRPDLALQVLEAVDDAMRQKANALIAERRVTLHHEKNVDNVYIRVEIKTAGHVAKATVEKAHTRISHRELDGKVLLHLEDKSADASSEQNWDEVSMAAIYHYAQTVNFEQHPDLKERIEQQISSNMGIATQSLKETWGQQVGRTLLENANGNPETEAAAHAAAGSDARMAGCVSPVTINAGSGNQGITCSVPVVYMARKLDVPHEKLLRALVLSNLIGLYQKHFIGKLSAFCGAVSAGAAAGCGVAYLKGGDLSVIENSLCNTLASAGGIVCDGAKGSCAIKIATALQNAFLSSHMAFKGLVFRPGDGIVGDGIDDTVKNIGRMAAQGMVSTDQTILGIMTDYANKA